MGARGNRYGKIAIVISLISLAVGAVGAYAAYDAANASNKANSIASSAYEVASSAYSVANNYRYVEVRSAPLELRPVDCEQIGSSNNVSCSFKGTFNVSFTIIAPHAGTYNISVVGLVGWGPFSPHPVSFVYDQNGPSVKIGNVTIFANPQLQIVSPVQGGVPVSSSQPFEKTVEVEVSGLSLVAPASSVKNLSFQGEGTLSVILTFSDLQEPGKDVQRSFFVHVDFLTR